MDFDFGKQLKLLRTNAKLTQQQLANRIGVSKSVISFYELRERTPSPEVLRKLCDVFHVSADFLLGISKEKTIDVSGLTSEDIATIQLVIEHLRQKNI